MMSEIEAGASKTKQALHEATDTVAETAKTQGGRIERLVRMGLRTLPLLPERTFEMMLDRMGLMRKPSGLGAVALFAGGFATGSIVTAFSTPYSGAQLRNKVYKLVGGLAHDAEAKAGAVAHDVVAAEKKAVKGAKDLAADAKEAVAGVAADAKGVVDNAADRMAGAKDGTKDQTSSPRYGNGQRHG